MARTGRVRAKRIVAVRIERVTHRNQFLLANIKPHPPLPSRPSNALNMVKHQQNEKYKCSQSGSGPLPRTSKQTRGFLYTGPASRKHTYVRVRAGANTHP